MANKIKYPSYKIGDVIKTNNTDLEITDIKKERNVKNGELNSYSRAIPSPIIPHFLGRFITL